MNQILQMEAELLLGSPGNEDILCVMTAAGEAARARKRPTTVVLWFLKLEATVSISVIEGRSVCVAR